MCLSIGETDVSKQTKFRLFSKLKAQERKRRCGGVGLGVDTGDVEVWGGSGHGRCGGVGWEWTGKCGGVGLGVGGAVDTVGWG